MGTTTGDRKWELDWGTGYEHWTGGPDMGTRLGERIYLDHFGVPDMGTRLEDLKWGPDWGDLMKDQIGGTDMGNSLEDSVRPRLSHFYFIYILYMCLCLHNLVQ
jgi:hypothetical protein